LNFPTISPVSLSYTRDQYPLPEKKFINLLEERVFPMSFLFLLITYHRNNNQGLITENAVQIGGPGSPQFPSIPHHIKKFGSENSEAMGVASWFFHVISATTRFLIDWI
jgi:hypothetical protein